MKKKALQLVVVGGGAAGLMAAIMAARSDSSANITILDDAKKLGAKILVSGGARCNVTHCAVDANDYAGGSRNIIKKILYRFNVEEVVDFFERLGVSLKQETTGKLFPVTDSARDVIAALLHETERLNITIKTLCRVNQVSKKNHGFEVSGDWGSLKADKVILSTGGKSLPKSGSDGFGYSLAKSMGHSMTEYINPALVPLCLPKGHIYCSLSGLTMPAVLTVVDHADKVLARFSDSLLFTHFGLSGPVVLDVSRYWIAARQKNSTVKLLANWLPDYDRVEFERLILNSGGHKLVRNFLKGYLPNNLVDVLCDQSNIQYDLPCDQLSKQRRKILLDNMMNVELPITMNRGFTYAEVTAGGVPLTEIDAKTMQSRKCAGLYLCGEICDVDGRIGGFNFQWAWSSAYVAGSSAVL